MSGRLMGVQLYFIKTPITTHFNLLQFLTNHTKKSGAFSQSTELTSEEFSYTYS